MKLSLCLATYNEEEFIHYPLDSAYDWVDEVIIVDGGSDDATVKIAKSYGRKMKVIVTDNPPMFHKNKQKAIEAARGDWILQLDADEELSNELKEEILQKIQNSITTVAYWIPRKNFFLTRFLTKGGAYPDYTIRLYKRGSAQFPCKNVHENVTIKGKVGYLKNPILHYADPNFKRYLTRWHRYNNLDAELAVKNKEKLGFLNYFLIKPVRTFFLMYLRHKGFIDGWQGFVFALFSSIRFWAIYIKWWQLRHQS